jgi:IS4 transposase
VGQIKEMPVLVGVKQRHPVRLLMIRVPDEIAEQRRRRLLSEASRRSEQVSPQALELCKWLLLLTDASAKHLSLQDAIVLQRERWQIELFFKLMARKMDRLTNGARHTAGGFCASCLPN